MKTVLRVVLVVGALVCGVNSVSAFEDSQMFRSAWNGGYAVFMLWLAYDRFKKP
jgi:hypothetical protein